MTRTATAVREGRFWVVDVPGVGVTQGRSVRKAHAMAADLVEAMTGRPEDIDVHFELPDDVRGRRPRTRHAADDEYRQAVRGLVIDRGMSKADVAALLPVSQQRVNQLAP